MAFRKGFTGKKKVTGFSPISFQGNRTAAMTPSGFPDRDPEANYALQPEMLANPSPEETWNMPKKPLATHHPTIAPKFPVIDKRARYKMR